MAFMRKAKTFPSASITKHYAQLHFFFWLLPPRGCFCFLLQREEGGELGRWIPSLSGAGTLSKATGGWFLPTVMTRDREGRKAHSWLPSWTHISIYYCKRHVDDANANVTQASFLNPLEGVWWGGGQWNKQSSSPPPASEKLRASTQPPETFRPQPLVFVFLPFCPSKMQIIRPSSKM